VLQEKKKGSEEENTEEEKVEEDKKDEEQDGEEEGEEGDESDWVVGDGRQLLLSCIWIYMYT